MNRGNSFASIVRSVVKSLLFRIVVVGVVLVLGIVAYLGRATPAGPASGQTFFGTAPAYTPHGSTLRLGTFNIDGGEGHDNGIVDLSRTAKSLQKLDFIGLEEVHGFGGEVPTNQAAELSSLLKLPFIYAPAEQRWGHDDFGNAVFTDLKVDHWDRVVLPNAKFHALRNYVLVDAQWQDTPIHFIVTHVDWKTGGDEQLAIVIDKFLHLPTPAVLLGDLNHPPSSPQIRQLLVTPGVHEAIREAYEKIPNDVDPSDAQKARGLIGGRVDWIFLRGLVPEDASPVDTLASDHPAYWAVVAREASPTTQRTTMPAK
jgi:endonuclease/exonuclease/phosphatase family metal-dependent hydrolase